jgi:phosphoglycolate phosphatase
MSAPKLKAVLFDKDGTLFDFIATWSTFCDRMLAHLGDDDEGLKDQLAQAVGYDRAARAFLPGSLIVNASAAEVDGAWAELTPGKSLEDVETLTRHELQELPVHPVCDLAKIMGELRALGFKLGVATNDYEAGARNQLTLAGAFDLFDFVCGSDSGYGRKPEPGMINGFCALHDMTPDEIVFVGDSTHDMHCGQNAGAGRCVGVLTGPATKPDLEAHASIVLNSIVDLPGYLSGELG